MAILLFSLNGCAVTGSRGWVDPFCGNLSFLSPFGCESSKQHFTYQVMERTPADQAYLEKRFELVAKNAEMELNRHFFLTIPITGNFEFSDERLVDEMLREYRGDIVTDLVVERKLAIFLYYNRYYVVGTGDVWRRRN